MLIKAVIEILLQGIFGGRVEDEIYIKLISFFFNYLKVNREEGETEIRVIFLLTCLLSCLQHPSLGQAEARRQGLFPGLACVW